MSFQRIKTLGLTGFLRLPDGGRSSDDPELLLSRIQFQLTDVLLDTDAAFTKLAADQTLTEQGKASRREGIAREAQGKLQAIRDSWEYASLQRQFNKVGQEREAVLKELDEVPQSVQVETRALLRGLDSVRLFEAMEQAARSGDTITLGSLKNARGYDSFNERQVASAINTWVETNHPTISEREGRYQGFRDTLDWNFSEVEEAFQERFSLVSLVPQPEPAVAGGAAVQ